MTELQKEFELTGRASWIDSEEIDKFIEENSSNTGEKLCDTRDALNVCIARLKLAQQNLEEAKRLLRRGAWLTGKNMCQEIELFLKKLE